MLLIESRTPTDEMLEHTVEQAKERLGELDERIQKLADELGPLENERCKLRRLLKKLVGEE